MYRNTSLASAAIVVCTLLPPQLSWSQAVAGTETCPKATSADAITDVYGDPLSAGALVRLGTQRFNAPGWSKGVAFTNDGTHLLSTFSHNGVALFSVPSGKLVRRWTGEADVRAVAILPDNERFVTLGFQIVQDDCIGSVTTYKLGSPDIVKTVSWKEGRGIDCRAMVVVDDTTAVVGASDGGLRIVDYSAGVLRSNYQLSDRDIQAMAISPDGATIAIGVPSGVYFWKRTDKEQPEKHPVPDRRVESLAYSPDGELLSVGGDGPGTVLISTDTTQVIRALGDTDAWDLVRQSVFTSDRKQLISASYKEECVHVWNAETGERIRSLTTKPNRPARLALSSDDKLLAATGLDGVIHLWDLETGEKLGPPPETHRGTINRFRFGKENQGITCSDDHTIRTWDLSTGKQQHIFQHSHWARDIALSPDGGLLASSSLDDTVALWNLRTGRQMLSLPGHGRLGGQCAIGFDSSGEKFVSWGDRDRYLRHWDVQTGKAIVERELNLNGGKPRTDEERIDPPDHSFDEPHLSRVTISSDGKILVASVGNTVTAYDASTGQTIDSFASVEGPIRSFAVSDDGKRVAIAWTGRPRSDKAEELRRGATRFINVYSLESGEELRAITLDEGQAGSIAISNDGSRLAVIASDRAHKVHVVELWNLASGEKSTAIEGFQCQVRSVVFSDDGSRIATVLEDNTVLIWPTPNS